MASGLNNITLPNYLMRLLRATKIISYFCYVPFISAQSLLLCSRGMPANNHKFKRYSWVNSNTRKNHAKPSSLMNKNQNAPGLSIWVLMRSKLLTFPGDTLINRGWLMKAGTRSRSLDGLAFIWLCIICWVPPPVPLLVNSQQTTLVRLNFP